VTEAARAVVLSGGYAHSFAETSAVLAGLAAETGMVPEIHDSVGAAMAALPGARLLVVNALWWSMAQHDKYAPHRAAHARNLSDSELAAMVQHVASGGGLLALHTATICWDTQPGWVQLMGGGWAWGRSHHPPLGPVAVSLTAQGAALSGASDFEVIDEAYHALDPGPDCRILAHAAAGGAPQPIAWTRHHERGRVAVDALGHDVRSLRVPGHAALLRALIAWAAEGGGDAQR
jgi:type 1 glutamine amidotransferase